MSGPRRQRIELAPEVVRDPVAIRWHVESWTWDRARADRTVAAIRGYLGSFDTMRYRGTCRDELQPGLTVVPFKRRMAVAFTVDDDGRVVRILCVFYAGQDYEAVLAKPPC